MYKHTHTLFKRHIQYWYKPLFNDKKIVIDIGSYNVNGTLKDIFPKSWEYIGIDRVNGPNVDYVMIDDYTIPVLPKTADIVVSSSCLQYVKNPFKLMKSINACLKFDGMVFISVPRDEQDGLIGLPENLCPNKDKQFDCWRFLPDGLMVLFEESKFEVVKISYVGQLGNRRCFGIGRKINE